MFVPKHIYRDNNIHGGFQLCKTFRLFVPREGSPRYNIIAINVLCFRAKHIIIAIIIYLYGNICIAIIIYMSNPNSVKHLGFSCWNPGRFCLRLGESFWFFVFVLDFSKVLLVLAVAVADVASAAPSTHLLSLCLKK